MTATSRVKDLTGTAFGRLAVLCFDKTVRGASHWLCRCECGREKSLRGSSLSSGRIRSCGCLKTDMLATTESGTKRGNRFKDRTGQVFGRWTVLRLDRVKINKLLKNCTHQTFWWCRCECGQERSVGSPHLTQGLSQSCGCLIREKLATQNGLCARRPAEYYAWKGMFRRCFDEKCNRFSDYGGRGITVCDRWKTLAHFLDDMGPRPSNKHSIDRIDNDGNYEPGNCRWATRQQQGSNTRSNRRLSIGGETKTLGQWAVDSGLSRQTLDARIRAGWDLERAVKIPLLTSGG